MKRIGSFGATVAMPLSLEDVRPPQGVSAQVITTSIGSRYSFSATPGRNLQSLGFGGPGLPMTFFAGPGVPTVGMSATAFQAPIAFRNGTFVTGSETIAIAQLDLNVLSDPGAIVVQTLSTEGGDLVMDDLLKTLEQDAGFRSLQLRPRRQYISNVVIAFEKDIASKFKELSAMQRIINGAMDSATANYGFERITFSRDLTEIPVSQAVQGVQPFLLERRANHPYSENRFFSTAPMATEKHFEVLEQIAGIIEA